MKVVYSPSALKSIESLNEYISEVILMPETGYKYAKKLLSFIDSIAKSPQAYWFVNIRNGKLEIYNVPLLIKIG